MKIEREKKSDFNHLAVFPPPLIQNSRCRTEKGIATKFKINTHNREVTHEALKHCMLFIVFILLC